MPNAKSRPLFNAPRDMEWAWRKGTSVAHLTLQAAPLCEAQGPWEIWSSQIGGALPPRPCASCVAMYWNAVVGPPRPALRLGAALFAEATASAALDEGQTHSVDDDGPGGHVGDKAAGEGA